MTEENQEQKEDKELTRQRDEKCKKVAIELLWEVATRAEKIGVETLHWGSADFDTTEAQEYYRQFIKDKVLPLFRKYNLTLLEADYVFRLMLQPIGFLQQVSGNIFQHNAEKADKYLWGNKFDGLDYLEDRTVEMIETVLEENKEVAENEGE